MKTLVFSGIATATLAFAATPLTASYSFAQHDQDIVSPDFSMIAHDTKRGNSGHGMKPGMGHNNRWGHKINGRWFGGFGAPGGWSAYRPAFRGFIMPRYWINPNFRINNYSLYQLRAPSRGYSWYRYYDDAVLSDERGYVYDSLNNMSWDQNESGDTSGGLEEAEFGPAIEADNQVYNWNDNGRVAFAAPDGSRYTYDGNWQGKYVDTQGHVFEGQWDGRVTRHDGTDAAVAPAATPMQDHTDMAHAPPVHTEVHQQHEEQYAIPNGYEGYEKCLRSNGVTGAAIGAILGGVAGNRIAGRGDRLAGSLIGAGLGGLTGAAIEQATDKCEKYGPQYDRPLVAHPHPQQAYPHSQQGWSGGYYYYPQSITTVTVYPGTTTTMVTEEVIYETVSAGPRKKVMRKHRPKARAKPNCQCR